MVGLNMKYTFGSINVRELISTALKTESVSPRSIANSSLGKLVTKCFNKTSIY